MKPYTITPRPKERDVLLQREGSPTVLVVRHEPLDMDALTAEARRIAPLLDGRAEAVIAAARGLALFLRGDDRAPYCEVCDEPVGYGAPHNPKWACGRLAATLAALDGGTDG